MARIFQLRRGKRVNLPTLKEGEMAFCTDEKQVFIGSNEGNVPLGSGDALKADKTLYVSPSVGSDTTGQGTASFPYATLAKALSTLPKDLGGYTAEIFCDGGTYSEGNVKISGFYGGSLRIEGEDTNRALFANGIAIDRCSSFVRLYGINANCKYESVGIHTTYSNNVWLVNCSVYDSEAAQKGIAIATSFMSKVAVTNCYVENAYAALMAESSDIYCYKMTAENCSFGMRSEIGSMIAVAEADTSSSEVSYYTATGGRIYAGAQTNMPLY